MLSDILGEISGISVAAVHSGSMPGCPDQAKHGRARAYPLPPGTLGARATWRRGSLAQWRMTSKRVPASA